MTRFIKVPLEEDLTQLYGDCLGQYGSEDRELEVYRIQTGDSNIIGYQYG